MAISKRRVKEIEAIEDEHIDYSDIPELDESFWANAKLVEPDKTHHVTLRIKKSVLEHFEVKGGPGSTPCWNHTCGRRNRKITAKKGIAEHSGLSREISGTAHLKLTDN